MEKNSECEVKLCAELTQVHSNTSAKVKLEQTDMKRFFLELLIILKGFYSLLYELCYTGRHYCSSYTLKVHVGGLNII